MTLLIRRHARLRDLVAILLLVTGWIAPLVVPHTANDDLCVPIERQSGAPAARMSVDGPHHPRGHCIICHSARSFRTVPADSGPAAVVLTSSDAIESRTDSPRQSRSFDRLPARAPPA